MRTSDITGAGKRSWLLAILFGLAAILVFGSLTPAANSATEPARAPDAGTATPANSQPTAPELSTRGRKALNKALKVGKDGKRWDVVLVLTDDQPKGMLDDMPILRREIADRGVTYQNALIPTSVCCPSRASLLTGELADKTGVYDNSAANYPGGYQTFRDLGNEKRTFAVALRKAGYNTGYFGKYLNEYGAAYNGEKPPGWRYWRSFAIPDRSGNYYDYPVTFPYKAADRERIANGLPPRRPKTKDVSEYSTTYFGRLAVNFIQKMGKKKKPMLTVFAPYAPHSKYTAETKYLNTAKDSGWWRDDPSVMEEDVTDKPLWVQRNKAGDKLFGKPLGQSFRKQRETLRSVDDQIGNLVSALRKTGRLDRTLFIFASDNGYAHGQHRLYKKFSPYRAPTEVPLIVRFGDEMASGRSESAVTIANIDIAGTIMRAAGLSETFFGRPVTSKYPRKGMPLTGTPYWGGAAQRPGYCGRRKADELFVRYGSGEEEYYDYRTDPLELENRVNDPAVASRVKKLRRVAAKYCDPAPPGFGPSFWEPTWEYPKGAVPADDVAADKTPADEAPVDEAANIGVLSK